MINTPHPMRFRAGRYLQQPTGYRAFIPAPLPPDPPLDLAGALRERLSEADWVALGIAPTRRAEELAVGDYVRIANRLAEAGITFSSSRS